jgi:hypothetical protein
MVGIFRPVIKCGVHVAVALSGYFVTLLCVGVLETELEQLSRSCNLFFVPSLPPGCLS